MLPHSPPEAQGISAKDLLIFVQEAEKRLDALHGFVLVRHGHIVAQGWWSPYAPDQPHQVYSLSKSFAATAVGLAAAEGKLRLSDKVLFFFPDEAPAQPDTNLAAMTVQDLLSMESGHAEDTLDWLFDSKDSTWTRAFLSLPVEHKPGTQFVYNTGATYMASAIVQRVTGQTLLNYLQPRLFGPLGIQHPTWGSSPQGVNYGGFGLAITTGDIARFGQLYLQKGKWQGRQLLPEGWVVEATAAHADNSGMPTVDWQQGYGYQFWRCRHGAYRGDGVFGQYCIVFPEQDAVLAITAGVKDMQAVLNLVWEQVLTSMKPSPLPADPQAHEALQQKLKSLTLAHQAGQPTSPLAAKISGQHYHFPENDQKIEAVTLEFGEAQDTITLRNERGAHSIACGHQTWAQGVTTLAGEESEVVAATGAWTSDSTYTAKLSYYQTPYCPTLKFTFSQGKLLYEYEANVSFGETKRPALEGKAE
ncbi:MAG: serine hydrolase [Candidatus Handelsmanbacteria bacterium]|nr:serine hydrolase [Candidatus Handelsmanbacteria bacterium]